MEEPADLPAVVVETSSSKSAIAVVAGSAGFETDRLPLKEALLRLLVVVVASYLIDKV